MQLCQTVSGYAKCWLLLDILETIALIWYHQNKWHRPMANTTFKQHEVSDLMAEAEMGQGTEDTHSSGP